MVYLLLLGIPIKRKARAPEFLNSFLELTRVGLTKVTESHASFPMIGTLYHQRANASPGLLCGREATRVPAPREGLCRTVWGGVAMAS